MSCSWDLDTTSKTTILNFQIGCFDLVKAVFTQRTLWTVNHVTTGDTQVSPMGNFVSINKDGIYVPGVSPESFLGAPSTSTADKTHGC